MIEIKHLKKEYLNITPLLDINAVINKGDVISLIGPSGTGKSTLLRCINRLNDATSGEIIYHGENIYDPKYSIHYLRQKIGMIFQSFNLFNNLNVIDNIMVAPVSLYKKDKATAYKNAIELLDRFSLRDKEKCYPHELSGGQKQRVAIMRAIATDPEVLLFDEPTSALDPTMVDEVANIIKDLSEKQLTMLIVTHELSFARKVSNRIFYLDEGIIYEEGTPDEIFNNPKKIKTQEFIFKSTSFEKTINKNKFDLYMLFSDLAKYLSEQNMRVGNLYDLYLVIEELTINEIFKNQLDNKDISIRVRVNNNNITIIYSNLQDFNYEFTNTEDISDKIINSKILEKTIDKENSRIMYILDK